MLRSRNGSAAVEFAIIAPILLVIIVGVADIGQLLFTRFRLDAAASAGAGYALVQAAKVTAAEGPALATQVAALARSDAGSNVATVTVTINNGPVATASGSGAVTASGTASGADQCYCPQASPFAWGAAVACNSACAGTSAVAGKFVRVSISRTFTPLFTDFGLTQGGAIQVAAVVQTQ
jgi:Flp pilus assembly protein TadG